MTMDYDLWTRLARLAEPLMLSQPLAYFRLHKAQKTSEKNIQVQADELAEIMCREGATEVAVATMRRIKKRLITKLKIKIFLVRIGLLNDRYLAQPLRSG